MKRKFSKMLGVAVTLAMLSSLIVAPMASALSAPGVALDNTTISGESAYAVTFNTGKELANTNAYTLAPLGATWATDVVMGASGFSAMLAFDTTHTYVDIVPAAGTTLANLDDTTSGFSYNQNNALYGPQLELKFTNGTAFVDVTFMIQDKTVTPLWQSPNLSGANFGNIGTWDGTTSVNGYADLAAAKTALAAVPLVLADYDLTRVRVELYEDAGARTAYIDDVVIAGNTYGFDDNTITLTFPDDTAVPTTAELALTPGTIQASPGWIDGVWDESNTANVTWVSNPTLRTITAILGGDDQIGEGATVRIEVPGITNPSAVGAYNLTVSTSAETAVTSAAYSVGAPTVLPLAGIIEAYNSAGVMMASATGNTAISDMMSEAGVGWTIKIGPGTYNEMLATSAKSQKIMAIGGSAETILAGGLTVDDDAVSVTGLTIKSPVAVNESDAVFTNCVFTKTGTSTTTSGQTLATYNNINTLLDPTPTGTFTNCTFDTTLGAVQDIGINVIASAGSLTLSGCTFLVDATALGAQDTAILTASGAAASPVTVSNCTITGSSGIGISVTGGNTNITGTTLGTLITALNITGGTVSVTDSTISGSGAAISATLTTGLPAINVTGTDGLNISNSTITGSPDNIMEVGANANLINLMFNDLSGNTLGIANGDASAYVQAPVNWWGSAAGPAALFNSGSVNASAPAGATATGAMVTGLTATKLLASATQGVDVQPQIATGAAYTPDATAVIAVGRYSANPGEATPQPALAGGFYDVYFSQPTTGVAATQVLIKFYNPAITEDTVIIVWSDLAGTWANCSEQGVNAFGGFAWVMVEDMSTPTILNLSGTPFALVEPPAGVPVVPVIGMTGTPVFGAMAAAIQPTFTWSAVAGATSYEFVLAEEIGQDDKFAIIDYSATTEINGHVAREQLKYDTVYNWRVRAVNAVGAGPWATSFFTTVTEPVPPPEPVPPVVIKETPPTPAPEIILQVPPATKQEVQVIPDYLLWVVVVVGAVLIIAVVILIVRTRRIT